MDCVLDKPHTWILSIRNLSSTTTRFLWQVFKNRVRVLEWMRDYDKLKSGRITKINFRRAMDLCKFELSEPEFDILEDQ